jgi:hypothetical protein
MYRKISERTNLPAICVLALLLHRDVFALLVGRICSSVLSNVRVLGKKFLSSLADRVCHGGDWTREMTFAPREEVGGKKVPNESILE